MGFDINLQKEIWLKHIEVQERILQLNSVPITVEPDSIQISGQRLKLRVCQTEKLDTPIDKIKSFFGVSDDAIDNNNDTIVCDAHLNPNPYDISQLAEDCQKYYIQLSRNPIIDGVVRSQKSTFAKCVKTLKEHGNQYAVDSKKRLQVTVDTLRELDNDADFPCDILPKNASGIFSISPTPAYFIRKWLPIECHHFLKYEKVKIEGVKERRLRRILTIRDNYFSESALQKLNELWGLRLFSFDVIIEVSKDIIKNYDFEKSLYDFHGSDNGIFRYHFNAKSNDNSGNLSIIKGKWQVDLLRNIYSSEFGENNCHFHIDYNYLYDSKLYHQNIDGINLYDFFQDLKDNISEEGISISESKQSIGVDFDWRITTPEQLRIELSNKYDDLEVSIFADHRCNVEIIDKNAEWEKIETFLKKNFSSLKTYISPKDGAMHFVQEYRTQEQASQFHISLSSSLNQLRELGCECEIHPNPVGKKKYLLRIDQNKIAENKENVVNTLRGAEFTVSGHSIGKLFKVIFPELLFDISSADYNFSEKDTLSFNQITPNLEGDIEKIKRLKDAFDNISTGKGVMNSNISQFIFDATKAVPTKDIEFYTNESSDYYQNIKSNLLNKHINPSQLDAIIKCLRANDISLIQGPPGTGKSTAIAELIWQHIRLNPQERILLTSETNLAVDNAIDRTVNGTHNLVKPIRFGSDDRLAVEGRQFSINAMEQWVESGKLDYIEDPNEPMEYDGVQTKSGKMILMNWLDNIRKRIDYGNMDSRSASLWEHILENPDKDMRQLIFDQYKTHCNVVGATCSSIGKNNTKNRPTKFFMNYCSVFGKVETKTIYKRGNDFADEDEEIKITTYNCKDGISFTTVIQDESSKATPAELALPLIYGKKNIVIGDHRQLPPMLDKEEFKNTLDSLLDNASGESELHQLKKLKSYILKNFKEMEISHFQRIYENIDSSLKGKFTSQYRMHPDINEVIKQFYEDKEDSASKDGLVCGLIDPVDLGVNDTNMSNPFSRYHGIHIDDFICGESLLPENHVVWIDVNSPEMIEGTSRVNEGEIEVISHILEKMSLSNSFKEYCNKWADEDDKEIGIISFYSKQRNRIRKMCRSFNNLSMKIDVVDRFQGMERNIIIVSMVRSNTIVSDSQQEPDFAEYELGYPEQTDLGFAQSPNRLNVALSRAKRLLIIIGNSKLFRQKDIYDNVYKIIDTNPNGKIIKCNPYEDLRK